MPGGDVGRVGRGRDDCPTCWARLELLSPQRAACDGCGNTFRKRASQWQVESLHGDVETLDVVVAWGPNGRDATVDAVRDRVREGWRVLIIRGRVVRLVRLKAPGPRLSGGAAVGPPDAASRPPNAVDR